jgi:hypothetical protein
MQTCAACSISPPRFHCCCAPYWPSKPSEGFFGLTDSHCRRAGAHSRLHLIGVASQSGLVGRRKKLIPECGSQRKRGERCLGNWTGPGSGVISKEFYHFGFGYAAGSYLDYRPQSDGSRRREHFRLLTIPSWVPPLLTALLPAWWFPRAWRNRRRLRRIARGECGACGYAMTGNTSGVCPECGTPAPKEPAEKSPRTG